MKITGWLFDSYATDKGITVWLVDGNGKKYKTHYHFHPLFYLNLTKDEEHFLQLMRKELPSEVSLRRVERRDLYSRVMIPVLEVSLHNPLMFQKTVYTLSKHFNFYKFYGADIKVMQLFYYITQLFPLAYGEYEIENDILQHWSLLDRFDAIDYTIPELSVMTLTPSMKLFSPKYQRSMEIEVSIDDTTRVLQQNDPRELIEQINYYLVQYDPDIILTEYGDSSLLPLLSSLAEEYRIPLHLNRDPDARYYTTKAQSYFSYGSMVHRDGVFELAGRWHIDRENSFIVGEADLEGLYDLSRMSQIGVQHQARTSIGSALSSMQISWAYRNNVLVPYKRPIKESFKTLSTLLKSDRGGLHFMPPKGYHEQVAELDFASMYPTLMKNHNISSETIDCVCCADSSHLVPELGYRLCEKHTGFVPETLTPILEKRARYKELKRTAATDELKKKYDRMQAGLKWILVTCFGYLGFKKSRMGRIEAHEAVNAFAREGLLRAKEIAEAKGFTLIHAIVDCVWLKKKDATREEYEALAKEIEREVGVKISLEGIYQWILFPTSKMDDDITTATRYVGTYENGEMKVRGLEVRRHDTCRYVKKMQQEMLDVLSSARSVAEIKFRLPDVIAVVKRYIDQLNEGNVSPFELVIRRRISKDPYEYANKSINAVVSQTLAEAGVTLAAGESIEYIITDASGKKDPQKAKPLALYALDDGYDAKKYSEFIFDAAETLLQPFGYTRKELQKSWKEDIMDLPLFRQVS
ncbi:MAG: DNA polymerase domain-containing protein [Bacteroidota bacterium]|nr:DNA polymerase domain-containing protein [Bacteroidota bacterium]